MTSFMHVCFSADVTDDLFLRKRGAKELVSGLIVNPKTTNTIDGAEQMCTCIAKSMNPMRETGHVVRGSDSLRYATPLLDRGGYMNVAIF